MLANNDLTVHKTVVTSNDNSTAQVFKGEVPYSSWLLERRYALLGTLRVSGEQSYLA